MESARSSVAWDGHLGKAWPAAAYRVLRGARYARLTLLYVLAALFEPVVALAGEFRVVEGDPLVIGGESIRLS